MNTGHCVGITCAFVIIAVSCVSLLQDTSAHYIQRATISVVCTTSIIADAVSNVGGDRVHITTLMGPGIDPHIYRAREHDIHALAHAAIILYNGLHLEGKMADILNQLNRYTKSYAVSNAIPASYLIRSSDYATIVDPHIWFDVALWMLVVSYIRDILCSHDPDHASYYIKNAESYLADLHNTHHYILTKASTLAEQQRILITAHDAFGYFGRAYGFKVIGLQGISTESEASPKDIYTLVHCIINHNIPAIFVESSIPHRTLEAVQHALHAQNWTITIHPELYSDALGSPDSPGGTYIGMVCHNIDAIVTGLGRKGGKVE